MSIFNQNTQNNDCEIAKILKNRIGSKNINTCYIVCQKLCATAYDSTIKAINNFSEERNAW